MKEEKENIFSTFDDILQRKDKEKFFQRILRAIPQTINTKVMDAEIARIAATYAIDHPDYDRLAARIFARLIQKDVGATFSEAMTRAYHHQYEGNPCKLVEDNFHLLHF